MRAVIVAEPSPHSRSRNVAVAVGATALVGAVGLLAALGVLVYLRNEAFDNELPRCERAPVVLSWTQEDGLWRRSAPFELHQASQTVQVDVVLQRDDGGVIQTGKTVYAIVAGGTLPVGDAEASPPTQPFPDAVIVGSGIDGVNEWVTLQRGAWELIVKGGASPAEVRWPC